MYLLYYLCCYNLSALFRSINCCVCCSVMHSATRLVDKRVSRVVKLRGDALTALLALSSNYMICRSQIKYIFSLMPH